MSPFHHVREALASRQQLYFAGTECQLHSNFATEPDYRCLLAHKRVAAMLPVIQASIESEAYKRLARYSATHYLTNKYRKIFEKRTGQTAVGAKPTVPVQWTLHRHYDPRYCLNHLTFIAKGVWATLQSGNYEPLPAHRIVVPKPGGGTREIDAFSIPDAAIAKVFLNNLRSRNARIFSDSSYAYRSDRTGLDAVIRLRRSIDRDPLFISQFDFTKYFDSISHEYLEGLLGRNGPFLTTSMERSLLLAVMKHSYLDGSVVKQRSVGIPQGNSLSLFLANVAAHPLDVELSRLNGAYARFADDSVVINYSYEDALRCSEAFHNFSEKSGVRIHADKSPGTRLLSERQREMACVTNFNFLSYSFHPKGVLPSKKAIAGIKRKCGRVVYNNLLIHLRRTGKIGTGRRGRGFVDWELVTCVNELRRYIYGGRSEIEVRDYLENLIDLKSVSGAVSYFCLVQEGHVFRELDGWLAHCLHRAYCERVRLINSIRRRPVAPIGLDELIDGSWYKFPRLSQETRLPSFFLAWRASRKSWERHGLGGVDTRGPGYTYA
jgi:hypothetical protein